MLTTEAPALHGPWPTGVRRAVQQVAGRTKGALTPKAAARAGLSVSGHLCRAWAPGELLRWGRPRWLVLPLGLQYHSNRGGGGGQQGRHSFTPSALPSHIQKNGFPLVPRWPPSTKNKISRASGLGLSSEPRLTHRISGERLHLDAPQVPHFPRE